MSFYRSHEWCIPTIYSTIDTDIYIEIDRSNLVTDRIRFMIHLQRIRIIDDSSDVEYVDMSTQSLSFILGVHSGFLES